jgi:hypothetical protein
MIWRPPSFRTRLEEAWKATSKTALGLWIVLTILSAKLNLLLVGLPTATKSAVQFLRNRLAGGAGHQLDQAKVPLQGLVQTELTRLGARVGRVDNMTALARTVGPLPPFQQLPSANLHQMALATLHLHDDWEADGRRSSEPPTPREIVDIYLTQNDLPQSPNGKWSKPCTRPDLTEGRARAFFAAATGLSFDEASRFQLDWTQESPPPGLIDALRQGVAARRHEPADPLWGFNNNGADPPDVDPVCVFFWMTGGIPMPRETHRQLWDRCAELNREWPYQPTPIVAMRGMVNAVQLPLDLQTDLCDLLRREGYPITPPPTTNTPPPLAPASVPILAPVAVALPAHPRRRHLPGSPQHGLGR